MTLHVDNWNEFVLGLTAEETKNLLGVLIETMADEDFVDVMNARVNDTIKEELGESWMKS